MPTKRNGRPPGKKNPTPCPKCGSKRVPIAGGGYRCRKCYNARKRREYQARVLNEPIVETPLPQYRERVQCDCGEWFERSTQRKAVAQCCQRCRQRGCNANVKDPTLEEIAAEIAALQSTWDDRERHRRAGMRYEPCEIEHLDGAWFMPGGEVDYGYRDVFEY
jgi:hypothetical protein